MIMVRHKTLTWIFSLKFRKLIKNLQSSYITRIIMIKTMSFDLNVNVKIKTTKLSQT